MNYTYPLLKIHELIWQRYGYGFGSGSAKKEGVVLICAS
jgi:hypothetical protein